MWVDRKTYTDFGQELAAARVEARVLAEQNRALQVSIDWFRVRISQLEMERAQMLYNYTGVKVSVPTIETVPTGGSVDVARILQGMPSFDDVGDKEASKLGLGWNADGTFKHVTE